MYVNMPVIIAAIVVTVASLLALCYSTYIVRLQDQHIERLTRNNYNRTRRETNA